MQIQRIQTLYILLAIITMVVFLFVPYGTVVSVADQSVTPISLSDWTEWGILLPVLATIVALVRSQSGTDTGIAAPDLIDVWAFIAAHILIVRHPVLCHELVHKAVD